MRQRLIYIPKHNAFIQKLYRVIMSFVFKVWGVFLPTDDKLVIFVSFMGMGFNDSPKAIFDYMQAHPESSVPIFIPVYRTVSSKHYAII